MTEQGKTIVRRYFTEVLNKGNYDLIKDLFSPSFIFVGVEGYTRFDSKGVRHAGTDL